MIFRIRHYLSLIKFSHTVFALPFALIGFSLGVKKTTQLSTTWTIQLIVQKLLLVILCMIAVRSAAMAFNRFLDRDFDKKNPRTAMREIPRGIIHPAQALVFVIIASAIFMVAAYCINPLCFYLSPIALFVVLFYSYTKRFTLLCHWILGLGLSLAPIGAYIAITGSFGLIPLLFSFIVIFWVSGFDIVFALQDIDFDRSENLFSVPAYLGIEKSLKLSKFLHLLCAFLVIITGVLGHFHSLYWMGAAIFIGLLIYQHQLIKPNDLSKINIAFMTTNGVGSIAFALCVIMDLIIF